jgi:hypothetical protein
MGYGGRLAASTNASRAHAALNARARAKLVRREVAPGGDWSLRRPSRPSRPKTCRRPPEPHRAFAPARQRRGERPLRG